METEPKEPAPSWPRPLLFGCPVDAVTMSEAVAWADARIASGRPGRIGAVNAAKLVKLERDPVLAAAVTPCELILADGMSVAWAAPLLSGVRLRRVAGIDLMEALVARAAEAGYRIYFLGAKPEILERMLANLAARFPRLIVAGSHHGYFTREDEPALVEAIAATRPDILFVAMGTPAKELWIDRNWRATGAKVSMGVGGSFDVFAGYVQRAPRWMQSLGLEWFYRLLQEPRRLWRRYLSTSLIFIGEVLVQAAKRPFRRGSN